MKTHFADVEKANESDNSDYWGEPLCNTSACDLDVSDNWESVTCKKCLKRRKQYEFEIAMAMQHSCEDMAGFVDFMESKEGQEAITQEMQKQ